MIPAHNAEHLAAMNYIKNKIGEEAFDLLMQARGWAHEWCTAENYIYEYIGGPATGEWTLKKQPEKYEMDIAKTFVDRVNKLLCLVAS
jgi:hypothetical protein